MPLTETAIRAEKAGATPRKLSDGNGLYLLISPTGAKWWRFNYPRPDTGKRNTLSLGVYPDAGLADARDRRDAARRLIMQGIDPGAERQRAKDAAIIALANTFEAQAWSREILILVRI